MENKDDLPFFVYNMAPLSIMLFNNKIFGFQECPVENDIHYQYKSFQILNELYQSAFGDNIVPSELHEHLSKTGNFKVNKGHFGCLTGIGRISWHDAVLCLEGDFVIESSQDSSILFTNAKYNHNDIELSVKLTFKETFLILSNLINHGYQFFMHGEKFDPIELRKRESKEIDYGMYHGPIFHYWISYTEYVKTKILDGLMHPGEILRTGGVSTLGYLIDSEPVKNFVNEKMRILVEDKNLSMNKQLMYFCLIEALNHYDYHDELENFSNFRKKNKQFLDELKNKFLKIFPDTL
jgi:hypothetical protein